VRYHEAAAASADCTDMRQFLLLNFRVIAGGDCLKIRPAPEMFVQPCPLDLRPKGCTMPDIKLLNPDALGKPLGQYSHMTRVKASEFLFIAGQVATDRSGKLVGADDFDAQCRQVFANIEAALKSQGASFANVVEFTTYLVHSQDIAKFMAYRLREFPRLFAKGVYPPNTLLIVDRLVQEPFLIEVQTIAAL
jgi:enamine deaminase RidA (YjgF/YER057c/UK114 family)